MRAGWVYILTNRPNGTLYTGMTSDLIKSTWQHREHITEGFATRHNLDRLVYFEEHATIAGAIQREKNIKHWPRAWKIRLIPEINPSWTDLYPVIL